MKQPDTKTIVIFIMATMIVIGFIFCIVTWAGDLFKSSIDKAYSQGVNDTLINYSKSIYQQFVYSIQTCNPISIPYVYLNKTYQIDFYSANCLNVTR